jgi:hypothetical protein
MAPFRVDFDNGRPLSADDIFAACEIAEKNPHSVIYEWNTGTELWTTVTRRRAEQLMSDDTVALLQQLG